SPLEMSQHRWYMPTSFLADRRLIDDEVRGDPRIDTAEDLYWERHLAQRTFLAFSGEVTANHCYQETSSTLINPRWATDYVRFGSWNWARLFPSEHAYAAELMPPKTGAFLFHTDDEPQLNLMRS